jgi:hypothetical protein
MGQSLSLRISYLGEVQFYGRLVLTNKVSIKYTEGVCIGPKAHTINLQ